MIVFAIACILTVAFTWGGYPLLVAALASVRGKAAPRPTAKPVRVSVVLATIADDAAVERRLADLERTNFPHHRLEIVVAIDYRRDADAVHFRHGDVAVKVVRGDAPGGKASALNAGVRAATGDLLVFTDVAQQFEPNTIPRLVAALASDERLGAVSGALHIERSPGRFSIANAYWQLERWLRRNEARLHSAVGVTGAVYAMQRALWVPLPDGLILDDLYTPMQLVLRGYRVGFDEQALAYDARHFAPREEYRRKARTLTGVLQLCAWLPAVVMPTRNPIWVQFVSHKLLRLATPYLVLFGGATLVWWLVATHRSSIAPWAFAALGAIALVPALVSRRVREGVSGAAYMQLAAMKATVNALRGHWDVWQS
ncbi:MAG: glycosyltransferase [Gemmatimonadaceae bacterium]